MHIYLKLFEHLCQAFDNAATLAAAYQVGKLESGAATNLLKSVSASVREQLKDLVRTDHRINFLN